MKTAFLSARAARATCALLLLAIFPPVTLHAQITPPNLPTLQQPTNGASFFVNSDVRFVVTEELGSLPFPPNFFSDGQFLGSGTARGDATFIFDWTNAPIGTNHVYAEVTEVRARGTTNYYYSKTNTITVLAGHHIVIDWASPTNLQTFPNPGPIQLLAGLRDTNGQIAVAEFFDGNRSLGYVSNGLVLDPPFPPNWVEGDRAYLLTWTNQTIGTHQLTIGALDANGQSFYSAPLTVFIESNLPPVTRIVTPPNHSDFQAPVNITLSAYANDPDGQVANVQFFAGSNNLGSAHGLPPLIFVPQFPALPPPLSPPTNTFVLTWSNAPAGTFDLTAVATDLYGAVSTSAPVTISILPSVTPPQTNYPDLVDVVASDPIAIASTNCWVWRGLTNGSLTWTQWLSPVAIWRNYTNCGPKDAAFTVHRFGGADSNLVVTYSLSGTATNGVDFVALPGTVTIPAGQRSADISIVPIDNNSNYLHALILTLTASTNTPPAYLIAPAPRAEALIIDGAVPRFPSAALLDGAFHLSLSGPDGAWFHIDWSTNLTDWTSLCTNQVVNGAIDFSDPASSTFGNRMYRVVPLTSPPGD